MKRLLGFFVIALLAGGTGAVITNSIISKNHKQMVREVEKPVKLASYPNEIVEHPDFISASEQVTPAVVHIKVKGSANVDEEMLEPFRELFGDKMPELNQQRRSSGSGVILSSDGYIVTNNHVVTGAQEIEVVLNDKRSFDAKVIGVDPSTDLALVKIDEDDLEYLSFGNSDNLRVGEWVLAVGNPFNLTSTVTAGIVSAKGRNINILGGGANIESFIQTDAAVNPGNSGGALVNVRGELVGINTAIASRTGSYSGYSFAVPVDIVKKVIDDLKEYGTVQRGFLGVQIRDVTAELAEAEDLKVDRGVFVPGFSPNSSAKEAGIEVGDVIVRVDDIEVSSTPELQEYVARKSPGDRLKVYVNREGDVKTFLVTLKNRAGNTELLKPNELESVVALGAEFKNLSKEQLQSKKLEYGVLLESFKEESPFKKAGIPKGFVVTAIDKKKVKDVEDILSSLGNAEDGILLEGYTKSGAKAYYGIGL